MDSGPRREGEAEGISEIAQISGVVFISTLAVQVSTFIVSAFAGLILPTSEFATLSLIVAASLISTYVLDFGLSLTTTKLYAGGLDRRYIDAAFAIRVLMLAAALFSGAVLAALGLLELGLGLALAGFVNLWGGVRAAEQAMQNYRSYTRSNFAFALVRLVGGMLILVVSRDAYFTAIALYAAPTISLVVSSARVSLKTAFSALDTPSRRSLTYAFQIMITQLTFNAVSYAPQFFIDHRLGDLDVGRFGIMLTFIAPISLVVTSIRNVLLPKMLGASGAFETLLWSRKGAAAIAGLACMLMLFGAAEAVFLDRIYGPKYPDTILPFLIFYAGSVATGMIGFYSLSIHTLEIPHIGMWVNIARVVAVFVLLPFTHSLVEIVAIVSAAMVIGEIILITLISRRRHA